MTIRPDLKYGKYQRFGCVVVSVDPMVDEMMRHWGPKTGKNSLAGKFLECDIVLLAIAGYMKYQVLGCTFS